MSKVLELFGKHTQTSPRNTWTQTVTQQNCPYLNRKCVKARKSQPEITIGTCSVMYGKEEKNIIICPHRLIERKQIFTDCLHLLTLHEPGNELHVVSEITIPGGSVDYFLLSVRDNKVKDFVGIELQTLDTTGTVWPERQRFLNQVGISVDQADIDSDKTYGMNWKMTVKTILVQLHHKIETFENLNKHLVLVIQDHLLDYMNEEFSFDHISKNARLGDPMHIHAYKFANANGQMKLSFASRLSTDSAGIATCLGLQADAKVGMEELVAILEAKISNETLFTLQSESRA